MDKEKLAAALHQFLLMYRDPVVYLAIDEQNTGFDFDEVIFIRMAKAKAMLTIYKLEQAVEAASKLHKELRSKHPVELQVLNLFTLIQVHLLLGNMHSSKSYAEEANILANTCAEPMLKELAKCYLLTFNTQSLQDEERLAAAAESLNIADHPFYRLSLLQWLSFAYSSISKHDIALSYHSAGYDLSIQHGLSICSLDIAINILQSCAHLQNHEMGEEFYALANRLIAQLRIPFFEIPLQYNYGLLKYALQDYKAAIVFFQKSIQNLQTCETRQPRLLINIYISLSKALNHLEMGEQALHYQILAEKMLLDTDLTERKINLSANIALSLIALKRWDEALKRLNEAIDYYEKHDNLESLIKVNRALAYYYEKREDFPEACARLKHVDELNRRHITNLNQLRSQISEGKLKQILQDSKALKTKYDNLLSEVTKRQTERFTGTSKAAKRVIDSALLAAMHPDATVMIQGESGSGKEVLARMIHYSSANKNLPFIVVNCAAISPSLFETEFFGIAAGQLTGATEDRPGFFEQAGEGTVFLDEISEIPLDFQAKLIWTIDTKTYLPVGKDTGKTLKCKILASTKKDVIELIKSNQFRLDLLHRLNTLEIQIPPLRERLEDIPLLVESFARVYARETTRRLPQIKDSFYERLYHYSFPGNVRELKNIIERIFIMYYEPVWNSETLSNIDAFRRNRHLSGSLIEHNIKDLDRDRIIEALRKTGGKQKTAAKLLNMSESTLCRKIKRYHIK
jgi:DNA-binding NtrC family response regulator